jgi:hypothetical protein
MPGRGADGVRHGCAAQLDRDDGTHRHRAIPDRAVIDHAPGGSAEGRPAVPRRAGPAVPPDVGPSGGDRDRARQRFSHQSRGDECDLAGLGHALASAGFRVIAWDADVWTNQDTLARLVRDERRRGARSVALVGASAGGATSLGAAGIIEPAVDAVVALSPSGQSEMFGDVVPAAGRYGGPLMVVTGEHDSAFTAIVPQIAAAHRGEESIRLLPGVSEHGKSLVVTADGALTAEVVRFVSR